MSKLNAKRALKVSFNFNASLLFFLKPFLSVEFIFKLGKKKTYLF